MVYKYYVIFINKIMPNCSLISFVILFRADNVQHNIITQKQYLDLNPKSSLFVRIALYLLTIIIKSIVKRIVCLTFRYQYCYQLYGSDMIRSFRYSVQPYFKVHYLHVLRAWFYSSSNKKHVRFSNYGIVNVLIMLYITLKGIKLPHRVA